MVLSSWQSHYESSPGSFDECRLSVEVAANPQTKPTDSDWESARKKWQLPSTFTIAILISLSPRADTHFAVPRRVEGWVDLGTAVWVYSPCPRLYIAVAVEINTTARGEIRTWARLRILVHINGHIFYTYVCTDSIRTWVQSGTQLHIAVYIKGSSFHKYICTDFVAYTQLYIHPGLQKVCIQIFVYVYNLEPDSLFFIHFGVYEGFQIS